MKELEEMHSEIAALELRYQIGEESENLSFQLVPIVYEWALQKVLSELYILHRCRSGPFSCSLKNIYIYYYASNFVW